MESLVVLLPINRNLQYFVTNQLKPWLFVTNQWKHLLNILLITILKTEIIYYQLTETLAILLPNIVLPNRLKP